jgi:hypothetical protein
MEMRQRDAACVAPQSPARARHEALDAPIEVTPAELESIRSELCTIERMLAGLFGEAYDRGPVSMAARKRAAHLIDEQFDNVVEEWCRSVEQTFDDDHTLDRTGMANALSRFVTHLRDPDDLRTYIYLRRHCQEGMISRAKPSQFNFTSRSSK